VDGQEVGRVGEARDEFQLVTDQGGDLVGHAFRLGVALGRSFPREPLQGLLRGQARHHGLLGILVGELGEREAAAFAISTVRASASG
jgi:hypothetical protein